MKDSQHLKISKRPAAETEPK